MRIVSVKESAESVPGISLLAAVCREEHPGRGRSARTFAVFRETVRRADRLAARLSAAAVLFRGRRTGETGESDAEKPENPGTPGMQAEERNRQAERLLDQYGNSILRYAYTFVHSEPDAEEILQETLIRYLQKAPVFENEAHEKAWLLRVAGNLAKNRIAYNKIRSADELNEELVTEQREDLSFVWEAVKSLPENQRTAIHLFYQEGYDTAGIASITGRREATVRSDLRRGRIRLKEILREKYDFAG